MPTTASNGIEIFYETFGDDDASSTIVFISGLGAQLVTWEVEFLEAFIDAGHRVVRFDNRDVGLSTKLDGNGGIAELAASAGGEAPGAPYLLADMAADVTGLLDELEVDRAHVVGASMGGMIAQTFAIEHPDRTATLTSIMSTTGDPDVGSPRPEVLTALIEPSPTDREAAIDHAVNTHRLIGSPTLFDEDRARRKATEAFDRCFHPEGVVNQVLAIMASGSRAEGLANLSVPALVIHGKADPLVGISGGERTAQLVPGADLLVLDEMGHDLPHQLWAEITGAIEGLTSSV